MTKFDDAWMAEEHAMHVRAVGKRRDCLTDRRYGRRREETGFGSPR